MLQTDTKQETTMAPPTAPPPSYDGAAPQPMPQPMPQPIHTPQQQLMHTHQPAHSQSYTQSTGNMQPPPPIMLPSASDIGRDFQAALYARCAQGDHDSQTKYGMCGIITAVLCFPIGLICLFIDTEKRCARCGTRLD